MPRQLFLLLLITLLLIAAIVGFWLWAVVASPVSAQSLAVTDDGVENRFPLGLEFSVSASGDQPIEEIRLRYTVAPDGSAASDVPDFSPGTSVSATVTLAGNESADVYLPPGTRIDYHWEVTDAAGETATTPERSVVYEDVRFDWRTLESEGVTIHYYSGSDDDAGEMLDVAQATLSRMSELLDVTVEFPVNVRIYDSTEDMRAALRRRSETFESQIITAGVRVSSDTVLVLGNVSFTTLRHELAHVVTAIAGEGPFGDLPAWLDEGTAVYAQGDPGGFGGAVERAVDRGNVLSVRSLTSYQGDPDKVSLFYGQSWSLVSYLIDTYGEGEFARLFAEIKGGKTTDGALEAVYGFDQDGLDEEWRASVGLPPREPPPDEEPAPTAPPANGGESAPTAGDDGGTSAGLIVALAVAIVAAAGVIGGATLLVARRMR